MDYNKDFDDYEKEKDNTGFKNSLSKVESKYFLILAAIFIIAFIIWSTTPELSGTKIPERVINNTLVPEHTVGGKSFFWYCVVPLGLVFVILVLTRGEKERRFPSDSQIRDIFIKQMRNYQKHLTNLGGFYLPEGEINVLPNIHFDPPENPRIAIIEFVVVKESGREEYFYSFMDRDLELRGTMNKKFNLEEYQDRRNNENQNYQDRPY